MNAKIEPADIHTRASASTAPSQDELLQVIQFELQTSACDALIMTGMIVKKIPIEDDQRQLLRDKVHLRETVRNLKSYVDGLEFPSISLKPQGSDQSNQTAS
jgi:hypothetical protein